MKIVTKPYYLDKQQRPYRADHSPMQLMALGIPVFMGICLFLLVMISRAHLFIIWLAGLIIGASMYGLFRIMSSTAEQAVGLSTVKYYAEIDEEGISIHKPNGQVQKIYFQSLYKVSRTAQHYILMTSMRDSNYLPSYAFRSKEDYLAFEDLLQQHQVVTNTMTVHAGSAVNLPETSSPVITYKVNWGLWFIMAGIGLMTLCRVLSQVDTPNEPSNSLPPPDPAHLELLTNVITSQLALSDDYSARFLSGEETVILFIDSDKNSIDDNWQKLVIMEVTRVIIANYERYEVRPPKKIRFEFIGLQNLTRQRIEVAYPDAAAYTHRQINAETYASRWK